MRVSRPHGHRLFARLWDYAVRHEGPAERRLRRETAGGARGQTLEIGVGVGANRRYLASGVSYTGIDPDPAMLRRAAAHARAEGREGSLVRAQAEALPFRECSFDAVIVTLTLCSVREAWTAIAEARRVLRPGGEIRFWEHVRPEGKLTGLLADALAPTWAWIGAGCRPNRPTGELLRNGGFADLHIERFRRAGLPMVAGSARRPPI